MKRKFKVLVLSSVLAALVASTGSAMAESKVNPKISVLFNGKKIVFKGGDPYNESGRVMVPFRGVGEALGAKVDYAAKIVTFKGDNRSIQLTIGSDVATVNGQAVKLDTRAIATNGRTFVPLRFISENFGQNVDWDSVGSWVWIGDHKVPNTDDDRFKLIPIEEFKDYFKYDKTLLEGPYGDKYIGIKIIKESDLPVQLSTGEIIYSIERVKRYKEQADFLAIRRTGVGNPIIFLQKNADAKDRGEVTSAVEKHQDGTVTSYYPVKSRSDVFINGKMTDRDWTKYDFNTAEYIAFRKAIPKNYIVALENPFN